jgi:hypothetical protein
MWRLAQARGGEEIIAARLDPDPLRYVVWGSKSSQSTADAQAVMQSAARSRAKVEVRIC